MNHWDWQLGLALICVAWAAAVLIRRAVHLVRQKNATGCGSGSCGSCPSGADNAPQSAVHKPLVSLQVPERRH